MSIVKILSFFGIKENPKWRLVPDEHGTFTLEKWHSSIGVYLCEVPSVTQEQADKCIDNLEKETKYYIK